MKRVSIILFVGANMKRVSIILFVGTVRELLQLTRDIKNDPSVDIQLASLIPQR